MKVVKSNKYIYNTQACLIKVAAIVVEVGKYQWNICLCVGDEGWNSLKL